VQPHEQEIMAQAFSIPPQVHVFPMPAWAQVFPVPEQQRQIGPPFGPELPIGA
jgi:hypothetical protein